MLELTKNIKNKAYELGFEKIGIAKPDFFSKDSERLNKWLSLSLIQISEPTRPY